MKLMYKIHIGTALIALVSLGSAAKAVSSFDEDLQPGVIFGSGNANGSFTVDRVGVIELGLRGKLRHNAAGLPENTFNSNGDGTYSFDAGQAFGQSPGTAVWSFEWGINTSVTNPVVNQLNDFTYRLGIDSDSSLGTAFITFDPINGGNPGAGGAVLWDHAIGINSTTSATKLIAGSVLDYSQYIARANVAQNSWKPHWFIPGFDPTADGTYDFFLEAYHPRIAGGPVARTDIQIIVGKGGSSIPDTGPTALLLGAGLLGLAAIRRKMSRS